VPLFSARAYGRYAQQQPRLPTTLLWRRRSSRHRRKCNCWRDTRQEANYETQLSSVGAVPGRSIRRRGVRDVDFVGDGQLTVKSYARNRMREIDDQGRVMGLRGQISATLLPR